MIFQFTDGEFSDPIATSLEMWNKINSFIVICILRHFLSASVSREGQKENPGNLLLSSVFEHTNDK